MVGLEQEKENEGQDDGIFTTISPRVPPFRTSARPLPDDFPPVVGSTVPPRIPPGRTTPDTQGRPVLSNQSDGWFYFPVIDTS